MVTLQSENLREVEFSFMVVCIRPCGLLLSFEIVESIAADCNCDESFLTNLIFVKYNL
jgi:hypothetical protein